MWAWGSNILGQLGNGNTDDQSLPVQVIGLNQVRTMATGPTHSFAQKEDGTLWAWGSNREGELGLGTSTNYESTPTEVKILDGIVEVSLGTYSTSVLKNDGTVWEWGNYFLYQNGQEIPQNRLTPFEVTGLRDVVAIDAGSAHSAALKNDGTVWTWGNNYYGQLGDGSNTSRNIPSSNPILFLIPQLAGLTISNGNLTPSFASNINDYTINVNNDISEITVTPSGANPIVQVTASVYDPAGTLVSGPIGLANDTASSPLPLDVGTNRIEIRLEVSNGPSQTYTIEATRAVASSPPSIPSPPSAPSTPTPTAPVLSGNARLSDIQLSSGKLDPTFSPSITEYRASVAHAVDSFVVTPKAEQSQATTRVNGMLVSGGKASEPIALKVGETEVEIEVKAANGSVVKYRIVVTRDQAPVATCVNEHVHITDLARHWAEATVKQAVCAGVAGGYPDETFKPNAPVTRSEFLVMLMNVIGTEASNAIATVEFTDHDAIGAWAAPSIAYAYHESIVTGYPDGTFRPNARITRAELVVLAAKAFGVMPLAKTPDLPTLQAYRHGRKLGGCPEGVGHCAGT
ncbi:cadherin-like beta sandwich domain-containing protein [Paenibacillus sp. JCM 10914]|uniref:cadherin-like beta sandwich domain-containing protein n=1 Tax=Paenibacillus sp. JCM 10914 TaxID=1236974 RepID=UPI00351C0C27